MSLEKTNQDLILHGMRLQMIYYTPIDGSRDRSYRAMSMDAKATYTFCKNKKNKQTTVNTKQHEQNSTSL